MEPACSERSICEGPNTIHVLELVKDDIDLLHQVTTEQLKAAGVNFTTIRRRESRTKSRTPALPKKGASASRITQEFLSFSVKSHNRVVLSIPKFLPLLCKYISNHLDEQGLFRLCGSTSRVSNLLSTLAKAKMESIPVENVSVIDVCSALKQLVREMEVPLIPHHLYSSFVRCLELPEEKRSEAILLTVFLLPKTNLHTLLYLMEFLYEVSKHSEHNKMDANNLAIVLAPSIMPQTCISSKKLGKDSTNCTFNITVTNNHTQIVKMLIEAGDRLGIVSDSMARELADAGCRKSEDELDIDGDVRKRKRSTSLNRKRGERNVPHYVMSNQPCLAPSLITFEGAAFLQSAAGVLESICKKKLRKGNQTPAPTLAIPNAAADLHTPVIRKFSRKTNEATPGTPLSTSTKSRMLSIMHKKKLTVPSQTPVKSRGIMNTSPAVCLNPRPVVWEDGSATFKTGTFRSRSLPRATGSRSLPSCDDVGGKGTEGRMKSTTRILQLTNSPRKPSPRQDSANVSPPKPLPPSISNSDPNQLDDCIDSPVPQQQFDDGYLRFTPMVREIKALTLAALREESSAPIENFAPAFKFAALNGTKPSLSLDTGNDECSMKPVAHAGITSARACRKPSIKARRCQSLNDASRARGRRTGHVPRRQSDACANSSCSMTLRPRRKPAASLSLPPSPSPIAAQVRKTAQSLLVLNGSPTRSTLRRGRPNTTRTGLSRPSPVTSKTQAFIAPEGFTHTTLTMDRKGRVSKRLYTRPALVIPSSKIEGRNTLDEKPTKPQRCSNAKPLTRIQSPKKLKLLNGIEAVPASYVASKLKREADGTVNLAMEDDKAATPTTPGRKGRSASMRNDMIRPSPSKVNSPYRTLSRKLATCYEQQMSAGSKESIMALKNPRSMRRGSSVHELVKKFDRSDVAPRPAFATLRRETRVGKLPLGNFQPKSKIVPVPIPVPPAKPPRTTIENRNAAKHSNSTTKQNGPFNMTAVGVGNGTVRGSNQVLKSVNLA